MTARGPAVAAALWVAGCYTGDSAAPTACPGPHCAAVADEAGVDAGVGGDAGVPSGPDATPPPNPPPTPLEAGTTNACPGYDAGQAPHATSAGLFLAGGFAQRSALSSDASSWSDNGYVAPQEVDGSPLPEPALLSIAQANGVLVAAASTGVLSSTDGKTWTSRAVPNVSQYVSYTSGFDAVAYGNGAFVVAASQRFNPLVMYRSTDGVHWNDAPVTVSSVTDRPIHAFTFAAGKFVAVGAGRRTVVSDDGLTWHDDQEASTDDQAIYTAVAFGNGTWVAVGTGSILAWSADGVHWTDASQTSALGDFGGLVFDGAKFLTCSRIACYTTSDGKTWAAGPGMSTDPRPTEALVFGNGVYVGIGVPADIFTSADGMTWTPVFCGAPPALQTIGLFK